MSVTRWISQDRKGYWIDVWPTQPKRCQESFFPEKTNRETLCALDTFQRDHPAAWLALDTTRDANGMAGPIEVVVSIEPKGEVK